MFVLQPWCDLKIKRNVYHIFNHILSDLKHAPVEFEWWHDIGNARFEENNYPLALIIFCLEGISLHKCLTKVSQQCLTNGIAQKFPTKVFENCFNKNAQQSCFTHVSLKSVPDECPGRMSCRTAHKSVFNVSVFQCLTTVSYRIVLQQSFRSAKGMQVWMCSMWVSSKNAPPLPHDQHDFISVTR